MISGANFVANIRRTRRPHVDRGTIARGRTACSATRTTDRPARPTTTRVAARGHGVLQFRRLFSAGRVSVRDHRFPPALTSGDRQDSSSPVPAATSSATKIDANISWAQECARLIARKDVAEIGPGPTTMADCRAMNGGPTGSARQRASPGSRMDVTLPAYSRTSSDRGPSEAAQLGVLIGLPRLAPRSGISRREDGRLAVATGPSMNP